MTKEIREDRWQHLLSAALSVGEAQEPGREMERRVTSLLEVFSSDLDPVDDFEAYAVRRFVQVVQELAARPPEKG
jgi:hypothetical protein